MSFLNITPKTVLGGLQHAKKIDMKAEVWHVSIPMTVLGGLQLVKTTTYEVAGCVFQYR